MRSAKQHKSNITEYFIFGASLALVACLFVYLASRFDITDSRLAYDWKIFWHSMENGHMRWDLKMFNPPWVVIFLLPLGFLPISAGWGLLIFFSFTVLVFSVPSKYGHKRLLVGILLLTLSYSALRNLIDANLEAISIAAILALLHAYRKQSLIPFVLGALLCTVKPQIVYLFVITMAVYVYQNTDRAFFLRASAAIMAIVILSVLWAGKPWLDALDQQEFTYGMSLRETGERAGIAPIWIYPVQVAIMLATLYIAYQGNRRLSYAKLGLLLAGGLLAAPFSNGHSMLVLLALGIIPLVLDQPRIGIPLYALFQAPYLFLLVGADFSINNYWTPVLAVCWITFAGLVYQRECAVAPRISDPPITQPKTT